MFCVHLPGGGIVKACIIFYDSFGFRSTENFVTTAPKTKSPTPIPLWRQAVLVLLLSVHTLSLRAETVGPLCEEVPLTLDQRFAQFTLAARYGDVPMLERALPDLPQPLTPRWAAAAYRNAIEAGQTGVVKFLITNGFDPNARAYNRTPLQFAVQAGHREIVQLLLGAGADPEIGVGDPLLVQALLRGHPGIEKDLLNATGARPPLPPLHMAAALGDLRTVQDAVATQPMKIDEAWGPRNVTPLEMAARNGHAEVARFLLKTGAAPSGAPDAPQAPVLLAARHGHAGVVEILLEADTAADLFQVARSAGPENLPVLKVVRNKGLDLTDDARMSLQLLHAAIGKQQVETTRYLLEWGAPVHGKDEKGLDPLQALFAKPNPQIFKMLQARMKGEILITNLKRAARDFYLYTPHPALGVNLPPQALPSAMQRQNLEHATARIAMLQYLLDHEEPSGAQNRDSTTLLGPTTRNGHLEEALWLLANGADPNQPDPSATQSILTTALEMPNGPAKSRLVHALLQAGVDPNGMPNGSGMSPLATALAERCPKAAQVLLEAGAKPVFSDTELREIQAAAEKSPAVAHILNKIQPPTDD